MAMTNEPGSSSEPVQGDTRSISRAHDPDRRNLKDIVVMNRPLRPPVFQLLKGLIAILQDLSIGRLELSAGCQDRNKAGYALEDRERFFFEIHRRSRYSEGTVRLSNPLEK